MIIPFIDLETLSTINAHKKALDSWTHGDPSKVWHDENNILCIQYADGSWWHYRQNENGDFEWW